MAVARLISARQSPLVAYIDVVLANLTTAVAMNLFQVPAGAIVLSGAIITSTAFNSTTSDVLNVGDTGLATRYKTGADIHATGVVALIPTGYVYTAPTKLTCTWTSGGGTPTTGAFTAWIEYIVKGRGNVSQGEDSLG